jgi:hypothetical protein
MKMLTSFSNHFDIPIELTWSDRITHIVVTSEVTREFKSTVQIFNGVLLNCFIVTMKWIHDCLESGVLIKEVINKTGVANKWMHEIFDGT